MNGPTLPRRDEARAGRDAAARAAAGGNPRPRVDAPGRHARRGAGRPPGTGARPGTARGVATVVVLGLAVQLLLPRLASMHSWVGVIRSLHPWALAGAAAAQVLSYWASGVMMRHIARGAGGRMGTGRGMAITLAAGSVGVVAWGALGFAGAAYRWARDAGAGKDGARLSAWLPTVLNAAVVAAAACAGMLELLLLGRLTTAEASAFGASLLVLLATGGALLWAA
ncbi:MAG TPA: hypothetical protein VFJ16_17955, partial [Longimicrobium sp.]|nr:hypothetical protein [Longimicrobium sp.]